MILSSPPLISNESNVASKTVTFDGTAGNGAVGTITLFTITGTVVATVFASCSSSLAGATATLALGTASSGATYIGTTTATNITNGLMWVTSTPAATNAYPTAPKLILSSNITTTVGTAAVTGGVLTFYVLWRPVSPGALIV